MKKLEMLEQLITALKKNGWGEAGETKVETFRTHSLAFGGGPLVRTGGRRRFNKGEVKMTVGKNTICIYRRPENPETLAGRGRLAGQRVLTFSDWYMTNITVTKQDLEDIPAMLQEIETIAEKIKTSILPRIPDWRIK